MAPQKALEVEMFLGAPGELGIKCEIQREDLQSKIEDAVHSEPGITVNQLAELLGKDRRTILGRSRDSEVVEVRGRNTGGRGKSYQLYPSGSNGSSAGGDE
jgi:hypothetical protein